MLNTPIHKEDMNPCFFPAFLPNSHCVVTDWFFHVHRTTPVLINNSVLLLFTTPLSPYTILYTIHFKEEEEEEEEEEAKKAFRGVYRPCLGSVGV